MKNLIMTLLIFSGMLGFSSVTFASDVGVPKTDYSKVIAGTIEQAAEAITIDAIGFNLNVLPAGDAWPAENYVTAEATDVYRLPVLHLDPGLAERPITPILVIYPDGSIKIIKPPARE